MELYKLLQFESDGCLLDWVRLIAKRTLKTIPASAYEFEDMVSIGLLALCKARELYVEDRKDSFQGFCYIKVRGAILDEIRRNARAYTRMRVGTYAYLESQRVSSPNPEDQLIEKDLKRELNKHLNQLSSLERSVVLQFAVFDKKNEEIARLHGRSTSSFTTKAISRVRNALREPLLKAGVHEYISAA